MSRATGRAARRAAAALALLAAVAGCGIRGTSVPVDAGGAPSRVSCKAQETAGVPEVPVGVPVRIYLVCGSGLVPVERTVSLPKSGTAADRPEMARTLLNELRQRPAPGEITAGFETAVPEDLTVSGPRDGDPADALRLSVRPEDLPSFALAQLVCTYGTRMPVDGKRAAVLGGPDDAAPRRYDCSDAVLRHPDLTRDAAWGSPLPDAGED
ncbi:hypothetical protein C3486_32650 [Streptomyces sp. Ru73]|uniref:hypothetical protein n=1 Tax=Streptomyces sp. Ru73 TaxID=2080748 RepID=UPI000CDD3805|nr:hypothetical protein [Streptomyces sp. Ru73]POX36610.1 hypothetical protein C3486_32650 [Streptomyces sp. Ru73]